MSTRSSIVYVPPLHIFKECLTGKICIETDMMRYDCILDGSNGEPTLTLDQLKEIYKDLGEYLGVR